MDVLVFFFASLSAPAAISLSVGVAAAVSVPVLLLGDAHRSDFDPRPWLSRVLRSEAVYPLLREWDSARCASREAFRDAAALLLLLTTSPKGAMS